MKRKRNKSLQRIASKAMNACVVLSEIEQSGRVTDKLMKGVKVAAGSGFFVAPDLIATNIHCVVGTRWVFVEPVPLQAPCSITSVVAFDDIADLVILRVSVKGAPLPLVDSDILRIGERVYAVRCTGGGVEERGAKGAITEGTLHGVRQSDAHLRLKTSLSAGNSGGPVMNKAGGVVGIAVASNAALGGDGESDIPKFAYAIPSNAVISLLAEAREEESFEAWRERPRIHAYAEASQGHVSEKKGQYKEAIQYYTAALRLNPDLAAIYHNRGVLNNVLGQHEKAIADWDAALERNPDFSEAYFNRGAAKTVLQDFEGSVVDCSTAIRLHPDAIPAYYNRALARMELKQYAEAIEDYDRVLKHHLRKDDMYGGYYNRALGKYLMGLDKAAEGAQTEALQLYHLAIRDYTQAIKVAPNPVLASKNYNNRGYTKYLIAEHESAEGNMEEASELYEAAMVDSDAAIKRDRKNAYAYCTRAAIKIAFDAHDAAIEDFDLAIKLNPDFAHAYYQRGLAKQEIGKQRAAQTDLRKAKELDPDVAKELQARDNRS